MNKKAFTLIEMLVVVLIIAILSAIGIMQYTHMVERTRVGEAQNLIGLAIYAQERQMMRKGRYTPVWTSLDAGPLAAYMDKKGDFISDDGETFFTKGGGPANPRNGYAIHFESAQDRWFAVAQRVGNGTYQYTLVRPFDDDVTYCIPSSGNQDDENMCVDIMALDSIDDLPPDPRQGGLTTFALWF